MPSVGESGFCHGFLRTSILLCAVAILAAKTTESAKPSETPREYRQRVWTRQHGLPSNAIQAILQTRDGFLWVATRSGLARFDGLRFSVINRQNTPAFKGDECTALAEDSDGTLWIGTTKGLVVLRGAAFTDYSVADGLWDNHITALCALANGEVWIGTKKGPTRFHNRAFTRFPPRERIVAEHDKETKALYRDRTGTLWIGSNSGVQRWDRESESFQDVLFASSTSNRSGFVKHLADDASGDLWIRSHYLRSRDDASWNDSAARKELHVSNITCIYSDRLGQLWLATQSQGLVQMQDRQFIQVAPKNVLPDNDVSCLYEDREGNLWIGTQTGGLVQWLPRRFVAYSQAHGLAHDNVWAVWERHDRSVWIGTESGLDLMEVDARTHDRSRVSNLGWVPMNQRRIHTLFEGISGTLWIGTGDGLFYLNQRERGEIRIPGNEIDNTIRAVLEDRSGSLWVAAQTGLHVIRKGQRTSYMVTDGLPANDIRALLDDKDGNLWVGTAGGGVCQLLISASIETPVPFSTAPSASGQDLDPRSGISDATNRPRRLSATRLLSTKNGLSDDFVTSLFQDREGVMWVGTKRGLNRLRDHQLVALTKQHGLPSDTISQVVEDDYGQLWVGCDLGIYRMQERDLCDIAEGRTNRIQCILYDESDGLLSSETNGGKNQSAALKTRDGRLWFCTTKGVVVIDPRITCPTEAPPPVSIEQISANGESIALNGGLERSDRASGVPPRSDERSLSTASHGSEVRFPPGGAQVLEIRYTAPTLTAPENLGFKYRLDGYDPDWRDAGNDRVAHYTNLKPGHYRFQVTGRNHHGVWNQAGASIAFFVAPHFYQTGWFYLIAILSVGASGYGLHRWRVVVLRKVQQIEQQHALEKERTRLARDMHDDLGARLTQIAFHGSLAGGYPNLPEEVTVHSRKAMATTREAIQALAEVVWTLNPQKDTLDNLAAFICQYCEKYLAATMIRLRLDVPEHLPDLPVASDLRRALFLVVKEALNNVVKHSRATEAWVRLTLRGTTLAISVEDDGKGFDLAEQAAVGDGLKNMKSRAEAFGGSFSLTSQSGRGTTIRIDVPLAERDASLPSKDRIA